MPGGSPRPLTRARGGLTPATLAERLLLGSAVSPLKLPQQPRIKKAKRPPESKPWRYKLPPASDLERLGASYERADRQRAQFLRTPKGQKLIEASMQDEFTKIKGQKKNEYLAYAAVKGVSTPQSKGILKAVWNEKNRGKAFPEPFDAVKARKLAQEKTATRPWNPVGEALASFVPYDIASGGAVNQALAKRVGREIESSGYDVGLKVLDQTLRPVRGVTGALKEEAKAIKRGDLAAWTGEAGLRGLKGGLIDNKKSYGGAQLLEEFGAPKGSWLTGLAGFATDVALDPLTYATGGQSAMLRAGARQGAKRVLKDASLMDNLVGDLNPVVKTMADVAGGEKLVAAEWGGTSGLTRAQERIRVGTERIQAAMKQEVDQRIDNLARVKGNHQKTGEYGQVTNQETEAIKKVVAAKGRRKVAKLQAKEFELVGLPPSGKLPKGAKGRVAAIALADKAAQRGFEVAAMRRVDADSKPFWALAGVPLNRASRRDPFGKTLSPERRAAMETLQQLQRRPVKFDDPLMQFAEKPKPLHPNLTREEWDAAEKIATAFDRGERTRLVGSDRPRVPTRPEYDRAKSILSVKRPAVKLSDKEEEAFVKSKAAQTEIGGKIQKLQTELKELPVFSPKRRALKAELKEQEAAMEKVVRTMPDPLRLSTRTLDVQSKVNRWGASSVATWRPSSIDPRSWQKYRFLKQQFEARKGSLMAHSMERVARISEGIKIEDFGNFMHTFEQVMRKNLVDQLPTSEARNAARTVYNDVAHRGWEDRLSKTRLKDPAVTERLSATEAEARDRFHGVDGEKDVMSHAEVKAQVVNTKASKDYDVYVGRGKDPKTGQPGAAWLGNPFKVSKTQSRREAIDKYENFLKLQLERGRVSLEELAALDGKRLGCWCAPQDCHAEVLVRMARWAKNELDVRAAVDAVKREVVDNPNLTVDEEVLRGAHATGRIKVFFDVVTTSSNKQFEELLIKKVPSEDRAYARIVRQMNEEEQNAIKNAARQQANLRANNAVVNDVTGIDAAAQEAAVRGRLLTPAEERAAKLKRGPSAAVIESAMRHFETQGQEGQHDTGKVLAVYSNGGIKFMPHNAPAGFRPVYVPPNRILRKTPGEIRGSGTRKIFPEQTVTVDNLRTLLHKFEPAEESEVNGLIERLKGVRQTSGEQAVLDILDEALARRLMLENPEWASRSGTIHQLRQILNSTYKSAKRAGVDLPFREGYIPHMQNDKLNELYRSLSHRAMFSARARLVVAAQDRFLGGARLREASNRDKAIQDEGIFPARPTNVHSDLDPTRFGNEAHDLNQDWWTKERTRLGSYTQQQRQVTLQVPGDPERFLGIADNIPFVMATYLRDVSHTVAQARFTQQVLAELGESLQGISKWKAPSATARAIAKTRAILSHREDLQATQTVASREIDTSALELATLASGESNLAETLPNRAEHLFYLRKDRTAIAADITKYADKWLESETYAARLSAALGQPGVNLSAQATDVPGSAINEAMLKLSADQEARASELVDVNLLDSWVRGNPQTAIKALEEIERLAEKRRDTLFAYLDGMGLDLSAEGPATQHFNDLWNSIRSLKNVERKQSDLERMGIPREGRVTEAQRRKLAKFITDRDVVDADFIANKVIPQLDKALDVIGKVHGVAKSQKTFVAKTDAERAAIKAFEDLHAVGVDAQKLHIGQGPQALQDALAKLGHVPEELMNDPMMEAAGRNLIADSATLHPDAIRDMALRLSRDQIQAAARKDPEVALIMDQLIQVANGNPASGIMNAVRATRFLDSELEGAFAELGAVAKFAFNMTLPHAPGDIAGLGAGASAAFRQEHQRQFLRLSQALEAGFKGEKTPAGLLGFADDSSTITSTLRNARVEWTAIERELRGGKYGGQRTSYERDASLYAGDSVALEYAAAIEAKRLALEAVGGRPLTPDELSKLQMNQEEFDNFLKHSLGTSRVFVFVKNGKHRLLTAEEAQRVLRDGPKQHNYVERRGSDKEIAAVKGEIDQLDREIAAKGRALENAYRAAVRKNGMESEVVKIQQRALRGQIAGFESMHGRRATPGERMMLRDGVINQFPRYKSGSLYFLHLFDEESQAAVRDALADHTLAVREHAAASDLFDALNRKVVKTRMYPSYIARPQRASVPKAQLASGAVVEPLLKGGLGGGQVYTVENPVWEMLLSEPELIFKKTTAASKIYNGWKWVVTVPNPGFWVRNFLGDSQNSMLSQGSLSYMMNMRRAWRVARYQHLLERRRALMVDGISGVDPNAPKLLQARQEKALDLDRRLAIKGAKTLDFRDNSQAARAEYVKRLFWGGGDPVYGSLTVRELADMALKDGVMNSGFIGREINQVMHRNAGIIDQRLLTGSLAAQAGAKMAARSGKPNRLLKEFTTKPSGLGPAMGKVERLNTLRENAVRSNTYIGGLQQTYGNREFAAMQVTKHHFDYNDLSKREKALRDVLLPFYTWNARNLPLWTMAVYERPGLLAAFESFRQSMAYVAGMPEDWQDKLMPQEALAMPIPIRIPGTDKRALVSAGATGLSINSLSYSPWALLLGATQSMKLGSPQPLADAFSVDKDYLLGLVQPGIKGVVELSANYSFYLHNDIQPSYRPLSIAPNWFKHLPDWLQNLVGYVPRYYDKTGSTKDAPGMSATADYLIRQVPGWGAFLYNIGKSQVSATGERPRKFNLISQFTGLRVNPYDEEVQNYRWAVRTRGLISEELSRLRSQADERGRQIRSGVGNETYDDLLRMQRNVTIMIDMFRRKRGWRITAPGSPSQSSGAGSVSGWSSGSSSGSSGTVSGFSSGSSGP